LTASEKIIKIYDIIIILLKHKEAANFFEAASLFIVYNLLIEI